MSNFGCPNTEQRTWKREFEAQPQAKTLNLSMRKDAPHYDSVQTRIEYSKFEKELEDD